MSESVISPELPFIKREGLAALKVNYSDREVATQQIAAHLRGFYRKNYPALVNSQNERLESSIRGVQSIYERNVFPLMGVSWGTYINNIGHSDEWPGCFRCHDGSHVSADGQTIPNDCDSCHGLLAVDEKDPKILGELGMK